jgi:hypothetical protein
MVDCELFGVSDELLSQLVSPTLRARHDSAILCASAALGESELPVFFALGLFRVYVLAAARGELLHELHLFDVKQVAQGDAHADPLCVESKSAADSELASLPTPLQLSLRRMSAAACDAFLRLFALSYRENLPQLPKFAACKFKVDKRRLPADLDRHVQLGACGGFVRSYRCCCAFYNVPPREDVVWTVNELWAFNGVREFNMLEFDTLERAHVKAVIFSLRYNDWFDSFVLSDASMPAGAWSALASCLAINVRLTRLELSRINDLPDQALAKLFAAMHENRACAIAELDVSRNAFEPRDVSALALLLSSSRLTLRSLSLNRCSLPNKSISTILSALCDEQKHGVAQHLRSLDLSHAQLTAAGASSALGRALSAATQLRTLILCSADLRCGELLAALWMSVTPAAPPLDALTQLNVRGCRDPTLLRLVRACANVRVLDVSDTLLSAGELVSLISRPGLTSLACSGMADHWSEDDVLRVLTAVAGVTTTLRRLEFDGAFNAVPQNAAVRAQAIEALSRLLGTALPTSDADNTSGLDALSVRGDGVQRYAGASLYPLLLSLAGASIRELDVRGNQLGDTGAAALARALQANATLRRLEIDQNGIGLSGFRRLLDALERNLTLTDLSLPVLDGAAMLKARVDDTTDSGISLASTAASRFDQRSATNVLAELHAIVMRNVQLAVLDAARKGKGNEILIRPRSRSQMTTAEPPPPNVDRSAADHKNKSTTATATTTTTNKHDNEDDDDGALRVQLSEPRERRSVAARSSVVAAASAGGDELELRLQQASEADELAREQAALDAERLALEQEALEEERRALERELNGTESSLAGERAALEAERAAIARELAQLNSDEAASSASAAQQASGNSNDDDWDSMSPEEQAIHMEIEKIELEIEQNEAKLVDLFDREQQALNATDDSDDGQALEELSRERRRLHNAVEESELRVESLKSKLAVGNFSGARRQDKPVKASAPASVRSATAQPAANDKGAFRAMLNAQFAQQKDRAAELAQMRQRRTSVMRPTFEASGEIARLLMHGQAPEPAAATAATAGRGAPIRLPARASPGAPLNAPARFRRGPAAPLPSSARPQSPTPPSDASAERQPDFAKSARESFRESVREAAKPVAAATPPAAAAVAAVAPTTPRSRSAAPTVAPAVVSPRAPQEPEPPTAPVDTLPRKNSTTAAAPPASATPRAPQEPLAPIPREQRSGSRPTEPAPVPPAALREQRSGSRPTEPAPVPTIGVPARLKPTTPREPPAPTGPIDTLPRQHAEAAAAPEPAAPPLIVMPARLKPSEARRAMRQAPPTGAPAAPVVPWGDATFRRNALAKPVPAAPRPLNAAPLPAADLRTASLPRKMTLGMPARFAAPLQQSGEVPPEPELPPPPPPPAAAAAADVRVASPPPPAPDETPSLAQSLSQVSLASARSGCSAREIETRAAVAELARSVDESDDVAQLIELGKLLKSVKPLLADALDVVPEFQLPVPDGVDAGASKIDKLKHVLRVTLADLRHLTDASRRLVDSAVATDQQLEATQELLRSIVTSLKG